MANLRIKSFVLATGHGRYKIVTPERTRLYKKKKNTVRKCAGGKRWKGGRRRGEGVKRVGLVGER
jgi:hypothetical protein